MKPNEQDDHINKWNTIVSAKDLKKTLLKHFSYLADSPGYSKVLKSIIQKVKQARIVKDALEIKFMDGHLMFCHAPATKSSFNSYPVSFQKIVSQHEYIVIKEKKLLGDDGGVEAYFDDTLIGFNKLAVLYKTPTNIKQGLHTYEPNDTYWVYHTKQKNTTGELVLFPIVHELEEEINPIDLNLGSLFLYQLVTLNFWQIELPEFRDRNLTEKWWLNIEWFIHPQGKNYARYPENMKGNFSWPLSGKLRKPLSDDHLAGIMQISLEEIELESLPLEKLCSLERLVIKNHNSFDVSIKSLKSLLRLPNLEKIRRLEISHNRINDLTPISKMSGLKILIIHNNNIKDISALTACKKLEVLKISGNPIRSSDLKKFKTKMPGVEIVF